jgi:parvulin-like peptidyl-prolyl isomerase
MYSDINVSSDEIIKEIKLSGQMPEIRSAIAARQKIMKAAKELGIETEDAELQQAADRLRMINNLRQAEDTYAWIQQQGLTMDEFEETICFSVLSGKLAEHLFSNRVEAYFVEHQLDYWQVVLYEVVLDDHDLAQELYFAINEGEMSFFDVAQEHIKDPELRRKCGYRGSLKRTDLRPEIAAAVFATKTPQLLKPLLTAQGAHLLLIDEIVEPTLNVALNQDITLKMFSNWLGI